MNNSTKYLKFILKFYGLETKEVIKLGIYDKRYSEDYNLYTLVKKSNSLIEKAKSNKYYKTAYLHTDKENVVLVFDLAEYQHVPSLILQGHVTNMFNESFQNKVGLSARSHPEIYSKINKTPIGKAYFKRTLEDKFGFSGDDKFIDNVEHWEVPSSKETESI
jgi:hypothetical protein